MLALILRFGPFDGPLDFDGRECRSDAASLSICSGPLSYFGKLFVDHPELTDRLLGAGRAKPRATRDDLRLDLAEEPGSNRLSDESLSSVSDIECQLERLRQFRNEQMLRIGLHDIATDLAIEEVQDQLTILAEEVLSELYPLSLRSTLDRYGVPRHDDGTEAAMCVLALGSLGAKELSYASDLDLVFVFSRQRQDRWGYIQSTILSFSHDWPSVFIGHLSTRMIQGRLYDVDTRLRPSGNQGTLVCTLDAFNEYQQKSAQTWERQALLRARPVAVTKTWRD